MITTLAIYLTTLLLFAGVGLAARALVRFFGVQTGLLVILPLGAVTSLTLLYLFGYLFTIGRAGIALICVVLATFLALAAAQFEVLRAHVAAPRRWRGVEAYIYVRRSDVLTIMVGALVGTLLLLPVFRIGFPTTIAGTIADGWSYAAMIDWLGDHTLRNQPIADVGHPLEIILSGQISGGQGVGFEMLATTITNLLGRESFEVINAVSATAAPLAVTSWACLYRALFKNNASARRSLLFVACIATPLFILPFSENQAPHVLSLSLWPFAVAMALEWSSAQTLPGLGVAGIAATGVLGVYTGILPWLLAGLAAAAAIGAWRRTPELPRRRSGIGTWMRGTVLSILAIVIAGAALGPFQVRQAARFIGNVRADVGVPTPRIPGIDQLLLLLGVREQHPFTGPTPVSWGSVLVAIVVVIVVGFWAWSLATDRGHGGSALFVIVGAVAVSTLALVLRFRVTDPFGYGAFKTIVSGGSIVAGCIILGLIAATHGRTLVPAAAALTASLLVWSPVSAQLLQVTLAETGQGFRAHDVELGRALQALPDDPQILVEGAAEGPSAFRLRMMSAYFGHGVAHRKMEGLGTTASYVASVGGTPSWRPQRPWLFVVTNEPQPVATKRRAIWGNALFTIKEAPELDVTPYGAGWQSVGTEGDGGAAWTSGSVELILSNRSDSRRAATLSFTAASSGQTRTVRLMANNRELTTVAVPAAPKSVRIRVAVKLKPSSTTVVALSVTSSSASASESGSPTLQFGRIDLTPA